METESLQYFSSRKTKEVWFGDERCLGRGTGVLGANTPISQLQVQCFQWCYMGVLSGPLMWVPLPQNSPHPTPGLSALSNLLLARDTLLNPPQVLNSSQAWLPWLWQASTCLSSGDRTEEDQKQLVVP